VKIARTGQAVRDRHHVLELFQGICRRLGYDNKDAVMLREGSMGSLSIWHWLIVGGFVMIGMFVAIGMARTKKLDEEVIRSGLKTCPFCAEWVRPEAIVCKHCGRDIQAKRQS
jgi:hypothetical protein